MLSLVIYGVTEMTAIFTIININYYYDDDDDDDLYGYLDRTFIPLRLFIISILIICSPTLNVHATRTQS